jgi:hypothetical protein
MIMRAAVMIVIKEIAMTEFKRVTQRFRIILLLYYREILPFKLIVLKARVAMTLKSLLLLLILTLTS